MAGYGRGEASVDTHWDAPERSCPDPGVGY